MAGSKRRQMLEQMLAETPADPEVRYALAMEHASAGDDEGAVRCFRETIQLTPDYVPAYLQEQGYRIIPVNPYLKHALGETAYPDLQSVPEPVDLVLLFQRSENVPPFVEAAIAIGAKAVWMQQGIYHQESADDARAAGLDVVMDRCMLVEHRRRSHKH